MTTLKQLAKAHADDRCPGQDETDIVWSMCFDDYVAGAEAGFAAAREIYTRSEHCEHFGIHQQDWDWKYITFTDYAKDGGESE